MKVGPEFVVSSDCEVAALDLETLPRSEVGKVDSEFRLNVSKANWYSAYVIPQDIIFPMLLGTHNIIRIRTK